MAMPPPPPPPPLSHSRLEEGLRPGGLPPDQPVSGFIVFMNVTNTVTHLLLGAVTFGAFICINMVAFIANELSTEISKFSAHVYLSVIGYVLLMSQAVLSLNPRTGWADNFKYPRKSKLYWSLQVLGSLLAVIGGIMAIVAVREPSGRSLLSPFPGTVTSRSDHLQSAHQIVGWVAMVLTTVSLVGGLVNLICASMVNNYSMLKAVYSWTVTLTLIIAFIAICLAFDEFRSIIFDTNANMAIALAVFVLVGMLTMIIGNMTVGGRIIF